MEANQTYRLSVTFPRGERVLPKESELLGFQPKGCRMVEELGNKRKLTRKNPSTTLGKDEEKNT